MTAASSSGDAYRLTEMYKATTSKCCTQAAGVESEVKGRDAIEASVDSPGLLMMFIGDILGCAYSAYHASNAK